MLGMNTTHIDRLIRATKNLRASLLAVVANVDAVCDLIDRVPPGEPSPPSFIEVSPTTLRLERSTYTVRWEARSCFLGYTMAFRVLERLARRPNEYVSTDRLLDELWAARRTPSTVRSTVCGLKSKLRAAGMRDVASMIDGRNPGHYGLMLPR